MSIEDRINEPVIIKGKPFSRFIQGGMGAGVSLLPLAVAVADNGGVGTVSSVLMKKFAAMRLGTPMLDHTEAIRIEVEDAKAAIQDSKGQIAVNIMCRLYNEYEDSVQGAIEGGADMIISGAGLPINLPSLVKKYDGDTAIVPIVSSKRALDLLLRKCWKGENEYVPDAIVLEGPKAGGHLGWRYKLIKKSGDNFLKDYDLFEVLLPEVLEYLDKNHLDIPVYVAGGLWDKSDFVRALNEGASGIQVGTPLAVCRESNANKAYKEAVISSADSDIVLGTEEWSSPCSFPFRYLKTSPMAIKSEGTNIPEFCICTGLFSTAGGYEYFKLTEKDLKKLCPEKACLENGTCGAAVEGNVRFENLYTVGTNATRVEANPDSEDGLYSVKEILERFGME